MKHTRIPKAVLWMVSLFLFAAVLFVGMTTDLLSHGNGIAAATLPFLMGFLCEEQKSEFGGGGGGAGTLTQEEFQRRVLSETQNIRTQQEKMLSETDRLDKETKKSLEELTKVKNHFDGLDSQYKALEVAIKKLNVQLVLEQRMAQGGTAMSFGQRLIRDEDRAKMVFGEICRSIGRHDLAVKALGEDSSPGSTMINDDLAKEVYDSLLRYGKWATLGVRPSGTKNTKIPVKTVRPVANFILTEGGAIADDTNKAGNTVTLEAEVIAVLLNVSMQLIEDGEIDVVADVMDDFIEACNFRADFASFQGSGAADATNGGVTGLFNFGTAATATATRTTIAATKYDDWLKCLTTVDAAVLERAARWWMHPTLMAAAIGVQDSNGRPIFQTALESPAGGVFNLFGFPVTMVGAAPSTNAASAKVAAFGDPRAYASTMRKSVTFEASDHARWTTLERSFRGHARFDAVGAKASALAVMTLPAA